MATQINNARASAETRCDKEFRREVRLGLAMPGRCRTLQGFTEHVVIRDVSAFGCRITASALTARLGARVVIRPAGMEGLSGTVRWLAGNEAGVEFDSPIYGPIVEHLHRQYNGLVIGKSSVQRRLGRVI